MKTLKLTPQQLNNLLEFLNRVQINGIQENLAYMSLIQAIQEASKEKEDKK